MRPELRRVVLGLLAGSLFLPIAILLILTVGRLLVALEDPAGAALLERLALLLGIAWAFFVVCLPLVLAVRYLVDEPPGDDERNVSDER